MLEVTLILVVILAILAIQTNTLRRAIVYLCVFSLLCSFCYLLYQAPDVAIAEAVIGSTLATIAVPQPTRTDHNQIHGSRRP